ncbi:ankyrin repeat protein [Plakobranchus ocellatus]|uniref:Ankyrin repeat protein n=1 Tax=Plakobranchus ocellatus TaxID=259542 RepID=A0AAV3YEJ7_9GAST|nr:ankyrin repeat protein [Plakobranchus ocellatus]
MASIQALHEAIIAKNVGRIHDLATEANVNEVYRQETAFTRVVTQGNDATDELCLEEILNCPGFNPNACNQFDRTPLHVAANAGRSEWIARLVEKGACVDNVDIAGVSPLSFCVFSDSDTCALSLISHGANVNQRCKDGTTPLHRACANGATKMANLLLQHGAEVNAICDKGETPLMLAVSFYYHYTFGNKNLIDLLDLCEALVSAGSDLNAHDIHGKTALHRVIESNNVYAFWFLVEKGCDVAIPNFAGITPFQTAIAPGSTKYELARYLLHYGAVSEDGKSAGRRTPNPLCLIHQIFEGMSKNTLNDQSLTCRALLLQDLTESIYPQSCAYKDEVQSAHQSAEGVNVIFSNGSLTSSFALQRLNDIEQVVSKWAHNVSNEPCSLQYHAKLQVRRSLGFTNFIPKISQLPVGASIKRYLNLGAPLDQACLYKEVRLHAAILSNNETEVLKSLASGCNVFITLDNESAVSLALRKGTDDIVSCILKHITTRSLSPDTSTSLPSQSFPVYHLNPSAQTLANTHFSFLGDTVLHQIAKLGRVSHVDSAVQHFREQLDARNFAGRTAMEEAVCRGHFSTAEALLEAGAAYDTSSDGAGASKRPSLLHLAAANGAKRLVEMLLDRGVDVNGVDEFGFTPLRLALSGGREYLERGILLPGLYPDALTEALDIIHMTVRGAGAGPLFARSLEGNRQPFQQFLINFGASFERHTNDNTSNQ